MVISLQVTDDVRLVSEEMDAQMEGRKIKKSEIQKLTENVAVAAARRKKETMRRFNPRKQSSHGTQCCCTQTYSVYQDRNSREES